MIRIPEFAASTVSAALIVADLAQHFGKPGMSTARAIDEDEVAELVAELGNAKRRARV
jgi:hypothetical protein